MNAFRQIRREHGESKEQLRYVAAGRGEAYTNHTLILGFHSRWDDYKSLNRVGKGKFRCDFFVKVFFVCLVLTFLSLLSFFPVCVWGGGESVVYRGRHRPTGQNVALKYLIYPVEDNRVSVSLNEPNLYDFVIHCFWTG